MGAVTICSDFGAPKNKVCRCFHLMPYASVMSIPFLSFIKPIFAWNVPLVSLIFLKRSLVFPILLFSSISLHWSWRKAIHEWSSGLSQFLQFQSEFGNTNFMIWATVSSQSCFWWLYRASPSLVAKNIINLILVSTIWWCTCVESSLVLLEEGDSHYQRNANQNHNEVPLHTSQNGCDPKICKQ